MLLRYGKEPMQVLMEGHAEHAQGMEVISVEITKRQQKNKLEVMLCNNQQPWVINYRTGYPGLDIKVAEHGLFARARADGK